MHIPDGFLDPKTLIVTAAASAYALKKDADSAKKLMEEKDIPFLGVLSAFVFAAQMVNFPVMAGTSGHFLGAAMLTYAMGPQLAGLAMASVLILQCLLFQDGGLLALGANIFNMAVVAPVTAFYILKLAKKWFYGKKLAGIFLAGWASVVAASIFCSVELFLSGVAGLKEVLIPMVVIHSLIGIGEGLITVAVCSFVDRVRNIKVDSIDNSEKGMTV
ncbi:energy-coupling factor ABC transporter permease [Thermovenabulum sp.]|uniref:energy-coupling factor ABC transporter permease n=1 Tax=Thermovenabulum sp. TaxID=3100335 RepID=UPI003C7BE8D4